MYLYEAVLDVDGEQGRGRRGLEVRGNCKSLLPSSQWWLHFVAPTIGVAAAAATNLYGCVERGGMRACIGDQCAVHEAKAPSARATASMMISVMRDPDNRVVLLLRLEENESSAYNREAHSLSSAPSKTFA